MYYTAPSVLIHCRAKLIPGNAASYLRMHAVLPITCTRAQFIGKVALLQHSLRQRTSSRNDIIRVVITAEVVPFYL